MAAVGSNHALICDITDCKNYHKAVKNELGEEEIDRGVHNHFGFLCTPHHKDWIEFREEHELPNKKNPEVRRFYVNFLLRSRHKPTDVLIDKSMQIRHDKEHDDTKS